MGNIAQLIASFSEPPRRRSPTDDHNTL